MKLNYYNLISAGVKALVAMVGSQCQLGILRHYNQRIKEALAKYTQIVCVAKTSDVTSFAKYTMNATSNLVARMGHNLIKIEHPHLPPLTWASSFPVHFTFL